MARKEETIIERMDGCVRSVHFTARRIEKCIDRLEELEKYLPNDATVVTMFRLQLNGIRQYLKDIGEWNG